MTTLVFFLFAIPGLIAMVAIIVAVLEYRAETKNDLKTLDRLEHELHARHIEKMNGRRER